MKKIFLTLFLLSTLIFTACGLSGDKNSGDHTSIKFRKILVIGIDDEYAPLGFRDKDNQIVGFDVDLAKEAGSRMGVTFEFKPIKWENKRHELESGEIDLIWNGLDITDDRKEYILYTKPYMENRQIVLVKRYSGLVIRSEGDLAGKIVGTQAGSTSENYVEENVALKKSFAEFKTYVNYTEALDALENEEIDVLIADELLSRYTVNQNHEKFAVIDVTIGPVTEMAIGFRKHDVELRDKVQNVFGDMVKDGTAQKISEQWFHADLISFKK